MSVEGPQHEPFGGVIFGFTKEKTGSCGWEDLEGEGPELRLRSAGYSSIAVWRR